VDGITRSLPSFSRKGSSNVLGASSGTGGADSSNAGNGITSGGSSEAISKWMAASDCIVHKYIRNKSRGTFLVVGESRLEGQRERQQLSSTLRRFETESLLLLLSRPK
jgi:hypothetical protein